MDTRRNGLQFSLKAALLLVTAVSVLVAIATAFPRVVFSLTPIACYSAIVSLVLIRVDHKRSANRTRTSPAIGSMMLVSVSIWTMTFIGMTLIMVVPGGSGPVQFVSENSLGKYVFYLRTATIIAMTVAPVICGVAGLVSMSKGRPIRIGWLMLAIVSYVVALVSIFSRPGFFPLV
jgi:hypothetical protein